MMKIRIIERICEGFLACVLVLALSGNASAQNIRVVVYGDSLTSGYQLQREEAFPAKMERKLKEVGFSNVEVLNMSVAGETTAGGIERVNSVIVKHPDIVILELGGNDAMRGISTDLIYNNLIKIVTKLRENNIYVMMIGIKAPTNMGYAYSGQLQAVYDTIASVYKLPFYPFALEGVFGQQELNLADGYHPNSKGVDVMVRNIYPMVDALVRWKWEELRYQQEYQRHYQQQLMQDMPTSALIAPPPPPPPTVDPEPVELTP